MSSIEHIKSAMKSETKSGWVDLLGIRTLGFLLITTAFNITPLQAHHQGNNSGGQGWWENRQGGGGDDVPEINGDELSLAILAVVCVWLAFNFLRRKSPES
mgnify:CR=1 FL=1|jgi:hypothetical protein